MIGPNIRRKRDKKLAIGMIGMGNISRLHVEAYRKRRNVTVAAISDTDQSLLIRMGKELGVASVYPDYRFMLYDPTIDVIDVMTPHYLHKQCVCDALEAGKTVICEKPAATNVHDIRTMMDESRRAKKHVYFKQYLRFSKAYQKTRDIIANGTIGDPYFAQCMFTGDSVRYYRDPFTWRGNVRESGGGVLMDIGVHMIDLLQLFFGSPLIVSAACRKVSSNLPQKGEDLASALIEFPRGMLVNLSATHNDIGYRFRWEVRIYGRNGIMTIIDDGKKQKTLQVVREGAVISEFVERDWWHDANIRAMHDIVDRIYGGLDPTVTWHQATVDFQTIAAAYRSCRSGRKVAIEVRAPTSVRKHAKPVHIDRTRSQS